MGSDSGRLCGAVFPNKLSILKIGNSLKYKKPSGCHKVAVLHFN